MCIRFQEPMLIERRALLAMNAASLTALSQARPSLRAHRSGCCVSRAAHPTLTHAGRRIMQDGGADAADAAALASLAAGHSRALSEATDAALPALLSDLRALFAAKRQLFTRR